MRHDLATASPDEELATEVADLLAELTGLREKLARAEAGLDAAATVAEARISAARAETKAVRELADRLTAELAEARRPWWRRTFGLKP